MGGMNKMFETTLETIERYRQEERNDTDSILNKMIKNDDKLLKRNNEIINLRIKVNLLETENKSLKQQLKSNKNHKTASIENEISNHENSTTRNKLKPMNSLKNCSVMKEKAKQKLLILSGNNKNKIYGIAKQNFGEKFNLSHVSKPGAGILEVTENLDVKLKDFTQNDYCIVLADERDFESTKNYVVLITLLREKLQRLWLILLI